MAAAQEISADPTHDVDDRAPKPSLHTPLDVKVFAMHSASHLPADLLTAWHELARLAAEPNLFFEADFLLPAVQHLLNGQRRMQPLLLTFWRQSALLGLFPVEPLSRFKHLPVRAQRLWTHIHTYYGAPLVRPGEEANVICAFYRWLGNQGAARNFFWHQLDGNGPFAAALKNYLSMQSGMQLHSESFLRPIYQRPSTIATFDAYFRRCFSSRHRKDFGRKRRSLEKLGALQFATQVLPEGQMLDAWIAEFLALEASGWKFRAGSAIACSASQTRFVKDFLRNYAKQGRLLASDLRLNGQMLAAAVDIQVANGLMCFKFAYDERFAAASPGALLRHRQHESLYEHRQIDWIDSCSSPAYRRCNRLMQSTRTIETIGSFSSLGQGLLFCQIVPRLERIRQRLQKLRKHQQDPRINVREMRP